MNAPTPKNSQPQLEKHPKTFQVGCVSFLNALPLIDGFVDQLQPPQTAQVHYDVPSKLLDDLEKKRVDIALCPIIDLQRSDQPLLVVPSGGIGCEGPTLTVRLYSKNPIESLSTIYADTDSHTSIALLRVLLNEQYDIDPILIDYNANQPASDSSNSASTDHPIHPDAMLLIGDKVVTAAPNPKTYPHQLDLGQAWNELTELPFVFAVWMTKTGISLDHLPESLTQTRLQNASKIEQIVAKHAGKHHWPEALAQQYLGHWLRYEIGQRQLQAMNLFFDLALKHSVISEKRPLQIYPSSK